MPRPGPRSPTICLRLPPEVLARVERAAKARRQNRSEAIRALLTEALDRRDERKTARVRELLAEPDPPLTAKDGCPA